MEVFFAMTQFLLLFFVLYNFVVPTAVFVDSDISVESSKQSMDSLTSQMSKQELQLFNSMFLVYEGDNIKGTQVKSLLSQTVSSNSSSEYKVSVVLQGTLYEGDAISTITESIQPTTTYAVHFDYNQENNRIQIIHIQQN